MRHCYSLEFARCAQICSVQSFGFGYSSRQGRQGRKVTGRGPSSRGDARNLGKISPFGRNDMFPLPWRPLRALREIFRISVAAVRRQGEPLFPSAVWGKACIAIQEFARVAQIFCQPKTRGFGYYSRQDAKHAKFGKTNNSLQTNSHPLIRTLRLGVFAGDLPVFGCSPAALALCGEYAFTGNPEEAR